MNLLRKLIEVTSIKMPSLLQSNSTTAKTRKQELIDLGLVVLISTLIVVYKLNKEA